MDQGKSDYQGALGILRECCQDSPLGCNQCLSVARMGQSRSQESADYHRGLQGHRSINPIEGQYQRPAGRPEPAHSKSKCQGTVIKLLN